MPPVGLQPTRQTRRRQAKTNKNSVLVVGQDSMAEVRKFANFKEFYPFYLAEHSNRTCRRLHYVGSILVLVVLFYALFSGQFRYLFLLPVLGYGFAWIGHFMFEKNKPATFQHPLYSLMGDWVMLKDMLTGRIKF